jgi:hypothetical protein
MNALVPCQRQLDFELVPLYVLHLDSHRRRDCLAHGPQVHPEAEHPAAA